MVDYEQGTLPEWLQKIRSNFQARVAHQFILHFNIHDYVYVPDEVPRSLRHHLADFLHAESFDFVLFYSQSAGLTIDDTDSEDRFDSYLRHEPHFKSFVGERRLPPEDALPLFEFLLLQEEPRTAIVMEYVEKLTPETTSGMVIPRDLTINIETLQRWALDQRIRATNNIILLLTDTLGQVAAAMHTPSSQCLPVKVDLPDRDRRLAYLEYLMGSGSAVGLAELGHGMDLVQLANLTQGFSLADLDNLNRETIVEGEAISFERVRERKQAIIQAESRGLLQEIPPRNDFSAVGGLSHVKNYFYNVVDAVRTGTEARVPNGVLFAGPPGTGKSIVAEALAKETGMNLVRMGNIRSMWVGESERNLDRALDLVSALAPVVVFVDEVDQAFGTRGAPSGDSGVSERIFKRILEFMGGNEMRGKVVWIAATNRPDIMDDALIRRFDRVIPFLPPDGSERARIFEVMPRIVRNIAYAPEVDLIHAAALTEGLTGSAIEVIVRHSVEYAAVNGADEPTIISAEDLYDAIADFKPNHNSDVYDLQSLIAIKVCNFFSMLPDQLPPHLAPAVERARQERSNAPIDEMISMLMERLHNRRNL
jgi:AAA+ superfamily predicted ATPase